MITFGNELNNGIMEKIAVFAGSFDPITVGHESIIKRAQTFIKKNSFPLKKGSG